MSSSQTALRDFIYLDVDRVNSLYSQVFKGLAETIIHSFEDSVSRTKEQDSPLAQGAAVAAQVEEWSRHTESKVLYDYMYNRLEEEIRTRLVDASQLTSAEELQGAAFLRASGTAEIEDYGRMKQFMDHFNNLGDVIAYAHLKGDENQSALSQAKELSAGGRTKEEKQRGRELVKELSDLKMLAAKLGLRQDETLLKNLKLVIELFRPDGLDVTIIPAGANNRIAFRVPVERKWLRISAEMLRTLYGNFSSQSWTVVGQVTFVPGQSQPEPVNEDDSPMLDETTPSLRDPFRAMFLAQRTFERMFLESKRRVEVVLCPLAIYRNV